MRRRKTRRFGAGAAVAGVLAALALFPGSPGAHGASGAAAADARSGGTPTTITGTRSGDHAWNPATQRPFAGTPSVTVDQTHELTDQVVHVTWKNFTPSQSEAGHFFGTGQTYYAVTVLQCRGTNPRTGSYRWPDFGPDCYNFTSNDANAAHGVGNEAYTLTGSKGQGETYFHVETGVENDFLGCDATHPCSLVVVPNWGGVQEPGYQPGSSLVNCADHSGDVGLILGDYGLDTRLGAACSWADRIVVPLHFAPTPRNCSSTKFSFAAEGAPMLARTLDQWRAGWCTGAHPLTFDFDSGTNEDLARSAFLSGSGALSAAIDVAVVNHPAAVGSEQLRPFAYAPLANSAISIAYHIDDQRTGKLITHLVLNARLVAKLITQSYSLAFGCTQTTGAATQGPTCDPAVKGNPVSIFDDPEFRKLNPEYPRAAFPSDSLLNRGQFLPLVLSGTSDMITELTRWISASPSARAFVDGQPDTWGMHVNTYYKKEGLPTSQVQILDPGYTAPPSNGVPGISTMQVTWNPISGLANVAGSLVTDRPSGINPTLPPCGAKLGVPCIYPRFGSTAPGNRALFAVVGLDDAAADRFPSAALMNAAGKPVGPSAPALRAALQHMTTNPDGVTQLADFHSTSPTQYPLTTVDYAMVPTCGLSADKADAIGQFLGLAARSERIGLLPGQLAPGNLPLNHHQLAQLQHAASAVSSAACTKPDPPSSSAPSSAPSSSAPSSPSSAPTSSTTTTTPVTAPPTSGYTAPVTPVTPVTPVSTPTGSTSSTSSSSSSSSSTSTSSSSAAPVTSSSTSVATTAAAYGVKEPDSTGGNGLVLPVLLAVVAAALVGVPAGYTLIASGALGSALARLRGRRR